MTVVWTWWLGRLLKASAGDDTVNNWRLEGGVKALSTRAVCSVSITPAHVTMRGLIMGAAKRYRWPYQNMSLESKTMMILSKQLSGTHHNADESARYAQVRQVQDLELCANIKRWGHPWKRVKGRHQAVANINLGVAESCLMAPHCKFSVLIGTTSTRREVYQISQGLIRGNFKLLLPH